MMYGCVVSDNDLAAFGLGWDRNWRCILFINGPLILDARWVHGMFVWHRNCSFFGLFMSERGVIMVCICRAHYELYAFAWSRAFSGCSGYFGDLLWRCWRTVRNFGFLRTHFELFRPCSEI